MNSGRNIFRERVGLLFTSCSILFLFFASITLTFAQDKTSKKQTKESLGQAEVNKVINKVFRFENIRREKITPEPAQKGQTLGKYDALRTEQQSRAEVIFEDGSLARIGSDAYFSFSGEEREVQMGKGAALFQVPKGSDETEVRTATATASLTGTTVMVEQQPNQHVKGIVLEGSMQMSMPDRAGESRELSPGQMVVMPSDAERIPEPVDVDLEELVETSGLVNGFDEEEEEEDGSEEETDTEDGSDQSDDESESEEGTDGDPDEENESDDSTVSEEDEGTDESGGSDETTESEEGTSSDVESEGSDGTSGGEESTEGGGLQLAENQQEDDPGSSEETETTSAPSGAEPTTTDGTDQGAEPEGESAGGLNMDQLSQGLNQQQEEIESGELEQTNMVIEGEGTEVTLSEPDDEVDADQTTESDNKDAVEQKEESESIDNTLTFDNESDVDVRDGTRVTTDGSVSGDQFFENNGVSSLTTSVFIDLIGNGNDVSQFQEENIELNGDPSFATTDDLQSVVFWAEDAIEGTVDQMTFDGTPNKVGFMSQRDDFTWNFPDISSEGTGISILSDGSQSLLSLGNIQVNQASLLSVSQGNLEVEPDKVIDAKFLDLASAGNLTVGSGSTLNGDEVGLVTEGSSELDISNSDIRTDNPSGLIELITSSGGGVTIDNTKVGFFNGSNYEASDGVNITVNPLLDERTDVDSVDSISDELDANDVDAGGLEISSVDAFAGKIDLNAGNSSLSIVDSDLTVSRQDGQISRDFRAIGSVNISNSTLTGRIENGDFMTILSPITDGTAVSLNSSEVQLGGGNIQFRVFTDGGDIEIDDSNSGHYDFDNNKFVQGGGVLLEAGPSDESNRSSNIELTNISGGAPTQSFVARAGGGFGEITIDNTDISSGNIDFAGDLDVGSSLVQGDGPNFTSSSTSSTQDNPSIDIRDSTQLRTLSDAQLTVTSNGGAIEVKDSRLGFYDESADEFSSNSGDILIDTTNPNEDGRVVLNGGVTDFSNGNQSLMANTIKARALGANGELLVDGSFMQADNLLKLYAPGSDGSVRFIGDSRLAGDAGKVLAGNTVQVDNGVQVEVNKNGSVSFFDVYSNNHKYQSQGNDFNDPNSCDGGTCGEFVDQNGGQISVDIQGSLDERPDFNPGTSDSTS